MSRPTPTRARTATNPSAPSHIALPPPPTFGSTSPRSQPGTPSSPGAPLSAQVSAGGAAAGAASPRSSFLPSFMQRNRPRGNTLTRGRSSDGPPGQSPGNERVDPMAGGQAGRPRGLSVNTGGAPVGLGVGEQATLARSSTVPADTSANTNGSASATAATSAPQTYRIRLVPHLESYRSLHFEPVVRELVPIRGPPSGVGAQVPQGGLLKVGRFTEKPPGQAGAAAASASQAEAGGNAIAGEQASNTGVGAGGGGPQTAAIPLDASFNPFATNANVGAGASAVSAGTSNGAAATAGPARGMANAGGGGALNSGKVAFKSKVVSRGHAEIWCEQGGQFFIRDTKSSSGTFLNHIRLSNPNQDSRPYALKDGDVVQLGVDYQGGNEEMYRCVKMKIEVGRQWGKVAEKFNTQAMQQLKQLGGVPESPVGSSAASVRGKTKASVTDCCICLYSVTVQQALFIAPCSHVFHYKCIRPLLNVHHPGFSCPLCRTFHDLEADVEIDDPQEAASRRQSTVSRHAPAAEDIPPVPPVPVISGPTDAERQATVLATSGDDMDSGPSAATSTNDNHGSMPIPSRTGRTLVPSGTDDSLSNAQTPMNETFFSTLADNLHETLRTDFGPPPDEADEGRSDAAMSSGGDRDQDREEPMFS